MTVMSVRHFGVEFHPGRVAASQLALLRGPASSATSRRLRGVWHLRHHVISDGVSGNRPAQRGSCIALPGNERCRLGTRTKRTAHAERATRALHAGTFVCRETSEIKGRLIRKATQSANCWSVLLVINREGPACASA
jgi:hypothetical protein